LNDPVKEPVKGSLNVVNCRELETTPAGNVAVALSAYDAVVAKEAVDGVNVIDVAAEAVVANELDTALLAQLLVPKSEAVILLVEKTLLVAVSNTKSVFGPGLVPNPTKFTLDAVTLPEIFNDPLMTTGPTVV
jgi:hypothetical protein